MNNLNLDKYLNIVNDEKIKKGLTTYIPLYPMLRVENGKLYVCVMLTEEHDNVWSKEEQIKPEYWVLIDIDEDKILEFNKTEDKDFVIGNLVLKNTDDKQQEISKYTVKKTLQYKNYLIDDIKNEELPLQKKLSNILGDEMEIDGEKVNINDYLLSNLEEDIKSKINDLVDVLILSKYGSITFYYDQLFINIVNDYKKDGIINNEKIKLCIEIMNNYYDGVIGIDNLFNI
ncbi:MAG: hypothetical protein ACI31R_05695 [Bacilli bacterium]